MISEYALHSVLLYILKFVNNNNKTYHSNTFEYTCTVNSLIRERFILQYLQGQSFCEYKWIYLLCAFYNKNQVKFWVSGENNKPQTGTFYRNHKSKTPGMKGLQYIEG